MRLTSMAIDCNEEQTWDNCTQQPHFDLLGVCRKWSRFKREKEGLVGNSDVQIFLDKKMHCVVQWVVVVLFAVAFFFESKDVVQQ